MKYSIYFSYILINLILNYYGYDIMYLSSSRMFRCEAIMEKFEKSL